MKLLVNEFNEVTASMIALRREVTAGQLPMSEFIIEFAKGRDKAAMDGFRQLRADFNEMEEKLLVTRTETAQELRERNFNAVLFGSLLAVLAAIGMGYWSTRSITGQLGGEPDCAA